MNRHRYILSLAAMLAGRNSQSWRGQPEIVRGKGVPLEEKRWEWYFR